MSLLVFAAMIALGLGSSNLQVKETTISNQRNSGIFRRLGTAFNRYIINGIQGLVLILLRRRSVNGNVPFIDDT